MMSSPVRDRLPPKGNASTGRKKRMHRLPSSSTWREKITARKDSIKEDIENALSHKRRKSTGKVTAVKSAHKREKVISEIFSSEKTYQEQLSMIIVHFMVPLQKLGLLPDPDQNLIFENVKSIQAVNKELLKHMNERGIPQAFIQLAPFFKVYCTYANNFEKSMQTLQDCERKRADFGQFLRQQKSKVESCSLNLDALLITPIQRVPRYRLLLQELLDNTPEDHEEYDQLQEAVTTISQVTAGINEYIREHENFQKMLIIQNCLTGANAPRILAPGRRFIKEGLLMKVSKNGNGSNERMFFLFNDMLVHAKPNLLDHTHMSRTFVCRRIVCLDRCEVQLVLGEQKVEGAGALFKIVFDGESLLLYSTDHNVALSWVDALQDAILQLKDNHVARRRTSDTSTRRSRRLSSSSGGRVVRRSRSILKSTLTLRNKRAFTEDQNPHGKTPKDGLYPMRTQILRRKLGTPGRTPPAKNIIRRRSQRLGNGLAPSHTVTTSMETKPSETPSTSNQSDIPNYFSSTQDKRNSTNVHIPPGKPLYDVIEGGSSEVLNENNPELSFCTLL